MAIRYEDKKLTIDDEGITIRDSSFPFRREKRIEWDSIRSVEEFEMGAFTGKHRIWGMGLRRLWFNLDPARVGKTRCFALDTGEWIKTALTPDLPAAVGAILAQRGLLSRDRA